MTLTDALTVLLGVLLGVAASIPSSLLFVAMLARGSQRRNIYRDLGAKWQQPDIVSDEPGREIIVLDAVWREVTR